MTEYIAMTFSGNIVIGRGSSIEEAKQDAEKKALALGSCIRKRVI